MTPTKQELADVLTYAAVLIAHDGLAKGKFYIPKTSRYGIFFRRCILGAVRDASALIPDSARAAEAVLSDRCKDPNGITAWNDHPERTKAEVVEELLDAASAVMQRRR